MVLEILKVVLLPMALLASAYILRKRSQPIQNPSILQRVSGFRDKD